MKPRPALPPGPYLVVGLARSGAAACTALRPHGEVIALDSGTPDVALAGVEIHTGTHGLSLLERARTVIKSPGVPRQAPVIEAARERGLTVMGELELGWRLLTNEFVAVTGTNGKTTTVELIGAIWREAGLPVAVAGNVGVALSSLAGAAGVDDATIVCEASSFQLEDTLEFAPEAAVLLNLTPDHLDRHGTFEAYRDAKLEIFRRQGNDDVAVIPDDLGIEDIGGCARRVCFGETLEAEVADRGGVLWWDQEPLIAAAEIRLRGPHNRRNAMAAAGVALARGIDPEAVCAALRTFAGVAHRLEEVAERDGVLYVNDSKATNVASTLVAVRSFEPGSVHLILGGRGKGQDFAALRETVDGRCAGVYLIGEDAPLIAAAVGGQECGTLERALAAARAAARPGQVVLLSPACASFDQFSDFEARGERFREIVNPG